jgi:hypothetical protein
MRKVSAVRGMVIDVAYEQTYATAKGAGVLKKVILQDDEKSTLPLVLFGGTVPLAAHLKVGMRVVLTGIELHSARSPLTGSELHVCALLSCVFVYFCVFVCLLFVLQLSQTCLF